MLLRDLLSRYPFWPPRAHKPIYPQGPLDLHRILGFTRQYCYVIWAGNVPPKPISRRILEANARAEGAERLQSEALLACEPHEWPEKVRARGRLASRRLRQRVRDLERRLQEAEGARAPPKSKGIG